MEAKEKPKDPSSLDPSSLREYEAIPNGGALLCAAIALASLAVLFMTPAFRKVALVGLIFGVALLIMAVTRAPAIVQWLKQYWRCNVRAYVVAHYTEGGRARCSDPFPRGHERLDVFLNAYPFVVLWPLGGWFSRPRAYWRAKQSWWSVARDTRFPGTPVKVTDKNGSSLRFATIGDAMTFIADRLECAAGRTFWHDSSDMPLSWLRVLEGLSEDRDDARRDREELGRRLIALFQSLHDAAENPSVNGPMHEWMETEIRRLIAERDDSLDLLHKLFLILRQVLGETSADPEWKDHVVESAQQLGAEYRAACEDRDAARKEREKTVAFIAELDRRFEESTRLHDKLQALRIHERIRERLYFHRFPTAWETSVANAHQQHDADAGALAEVRARIKVQEKRDRRRHGKSAATTAT